MPLTLESRSQVKDFLVTKVKHYIAKQKAKGDPMDVQPFHARLLPELFKIPLSERSFSTSLGAWFEDIAVIVARQFHAEAQRNFEIHGSLQPAVSSHIETLLEQMDKGKPKLKPNRERDISKLLGVQSDGGAIASARADLFVRTHSGEEWYFEMKTAQPNKIQCKEMKRFILRVAALRHNYDAQAFASTAYNANGHGKPEGDGRMRQFLDVGKDILIGSAFWTKIGDEDVYGELLAIAAEVGKETTNEVA